MATGEAVGWIRMPRPPHAVKTMAVRLASQEKISSPALRSKEMELYEDVSLFIEDSMLSQRAMATSPHTADILCNIICVR